MKESDHEKVSQARNLWLLQHREKGSPITGPLLQEKALNFYEELKENGDPPFTASSGWLDGWKKRYGIKQLSISGEKLSANIENYLKFKENFQKFIEDEGLSGDQIYNSDEAGLNSMHPVKNFGFKKRKIST